MLRPTAGFKQPPLIGYASRTQTPRATEVNSELRRSSLLENLAWLSVWLKKTVVNMIEAIVSITTAWKTNDSPFAIVLSLMVKLEPASVMTKVRKAPANAPPNYAMR
jgi:hypothetical protein